MSGLDHARLVAATIAELKSKGFALDAAPKLATTGKSGVEVFVDALALATVEEIENHYSGTSGTGTDSILNSLVGDGVPKRTGTTWAMVNDLLTQSAADLRYATPTTVAAAVATRQAASNDLTAIADASGLGYLKKVASGVWSLVSSIPWGDLSGVPSVTAGSGLTGGGLLTAGVTLAVAFAGTGSAATVARSDHSHSGYAASSHTHTASQISDSTATGRSVLVAADQSAARTALGLSGWATKAYTNGSTTDVAEGTNLYYTDARARAAITATSPIIASAGVISHSAADGNLHVPATGTTSNGKWLRAGSTAGSVSWQTLVVGDLPDHTHTASQISDSTATGRSVLTALDQAAARTALGLSGWATKAYTNGSTTDVAEGSNLYYTDVRARASITATTPIIATAGVISHSAADGNLHVPATGTTSNGKWLRAGSTAGSVSWQTLVVGDLPDHTHTASQISDSTAIGRSVLVAADQSAARTALGLSGWATKAYTNGSTTDVAEGSNLYYTDARARASITATIPIIATAGVISHSTADGNLHVPATGTTSNGKWLRAGSTAGSVSWQELAAVDLPIHAPRHYWDGPDPIAGQSLSGLRVTSTPEFSGCVLNGMQWFKSSGSRAWSILGSSTAFELGSRNSDGSAIDWPIVIGHDAGGVIRLGGTTSRPVNLMFSLQFGGLETINSAREGVLTKISVKKALGATIETASRVDLINDTGTWGASSWTDSGGNLRLAFLQGDAVWTDRFKFLRTGAFQIGGADAITASRGGRLTDLIVTGQTTLSTSLTGLLKGAAGVIGVASASDLPSHTHSASQISDSTATGRSILVAADQATARTALGLTSWAIKAFTNGSTTDVAEGTNLYYTDARARASITATTPIIATAGVISHSAADGNLHVPATGTTSNGKWLRAEATAGSFSWQTLSSSDLPSHASIHHWNGADPLAGQSIAGLLVTSKPTFTGLYVKEASSNLSDLAFLTSTDVRRMALITGTNADGGGLAIYSYDDSGAFRSSRIFVPRSNSFPVSIENGLKVSSGNLTLNTSFNGILKATAGVVSVAGAASIDASLVNVPYGRIPFGGSNGLTWSDKLRWNDPYTDMFWVDASATFRGTVYADDLQLPIDGSIVSFSAAMIQFGDGVTVPRVLFPNTATNKAFQVDGLATFAHIDAYLLEGDVQPDRDEIPSGGTRTLPSANVVGKSARFCAGIGPGTYSVSVANPAAEVIIYRSRTTGLRLSATTLDIVDSATEFVCHAIGRWTAIGY
ncbi:MAG TPA: hypothetical protein PKY05_00280 [Fibrobacteria bacterium]|mgnify:CR=1 FL=1|nr:hypothetical protein [Fibrobacteria bacterium]